MDTFDALVIGGGPAGLQTALMLGRARRRVLVVDAGQPRNRFTTHLHALIGHDATPPGELLTAGRADLSRYGVEFVRGHVASVEFDASPARDGEALIGGRALIADLVLSPDVDGSGSGSGEPGTRIRVRSRSVVLATGLRDDLADIPGLRERWGSTVLHCPYCHGYEVRDQRIAVLATGPMSLHQVQLVRQWSDDVVLVNADATGLDAALAARLAARRIRIERAPAVAIEGPAPRIDGIRLADGTPAGGGCDPHRRRTASAR